MRFPELHHTYLLPFCRFPTPVGNIISDLLQAAKLIPVVHRPATNCSDFKRAWKPTEGWDKQAIEDHEERLAEWTELMEGVIPTDNISRQR